MAQLIKNANIFGRLGTGFGKGLAEQIPKEVERNRLSRGLEEIQKESSNLTPFQKYSKLLTQPGLTPQGLQGASELLRQEAYSNAFRGENNENKPESAKFPEKNKQNENQQKNEIPSLTSEEDFAKSQQGYIPPSQDEIFDRARERFDENPAFYQNDPNKAIEVEERSALKEKEIAEAYQRRHENLTTAQDNVLGRLQAHSNKLEADVPADVYSKIEDEAIKSVQPKSKGGEGLTEQQAIKTYGKKLDKISRDYKAIDSLGNIGVILRPAKETLSAIKALQGEFEERDDTENFADQLISKTGLSPIMAYSQAQPVWKVEELNKAISKLPSIKGSLSAGGGILGVDINQIKKKRQKTSEVVRDLAPLLGKGSPLAVAYELEKLGYDPRIWIDYLIDHRKELKLEESQGRQLDEAGNLTGTINDYWLKAWSGIK